MNFYIVLNNERVNGFGTESWALLFWGETFSNRNLHFHRILMKHSSCESILECNNINIETP